MNINDLDQSNIQFDSPTPSEATPTNIADIHPDNVDFHDPNAPSAAEAYGRGILQGGTANLEPYIAAADERGFSKLDNMLGGRLSAAGQGDSLSDRLAGLVVGLSPEEQKAILDVYGNTSNKELVNTEAQNNKAAAAAHPTASLLGNITGGVPLALGASELAGLGTAALGEQAGLGSLAATEAAPAATGLAKAGLVGINAAGQGAAQGALGAIAGYNADPNASDADKMHNAETAAGGSALLAGGLSAAAPYAPTITRTLGGGLLGAAALNATNPLHPTWGKTLLGAGIGAGLANAAPAVVNKLGIANDLADSQNYGKEGISLVSKGDVNRVQTGITDLANKVTDSLGDLDKTVTTPALEHIQTTYQGALESLTKDLKATPEQAAQIMNQGQESALNSLKSLTAEAQSQGKTVSTRDVIQALKEELKQAISLSGSVVGDVDRKTVQNAVDNLDGYLTKQGMPIDIKSSTILDSQGKPFIANLQVNGKALTAEQVKNLIDPSTGQIDSSKLQGLVGGPQSEITPVSSSIKTTQMGGNNPEGKLIPNTSMPPPDMQIPGGEITPEQLENNTAMQTVPGTEPDSSARPMFTQIDAKQQVIPQQPQSGEMSIPEAQNLKRLMGKLGYDSAAIPGEVKGSFIGANQDLNQIIAGAFQPAEEGAVNPYLDANAKLTAIHDLGKLVGVPTKIYSTGEQIPSTTLQNIVKGVGSSLTDADNGKYQQIVKLLSVLDPEGAQSFQNNVEKFSTGLANMKTAGTDPLAQQAALSEQGFNTPETDMAAKNIDQMNTIKNTVGGIGSDVDENGNPLPESKTYSFIKNLGQAGPVENIRSEIDPVVKTKVDNAIQLLSQYDPDLVDTLNTQGKSLARQNELLENNDVNPKSIMGRTGYFVKQGLVRGANLVGQAENSPWVSPFTKALPALIKVGALGKYSAPMAAAIQRGRNSVVATDNALSQSDPDYKTWKDTFNSVFTGEQPPATSDSQDSATKQSAMGGGINRDRLGVISNIADNKPAELGPYAAQLQAAKARGPQALAATNYILSQRDPNYRKKVEGVDNHASETLRDNQ